MQTDSYVAVQLIEQQRALTPDRLKHMAESVEGSFVFTVLDDRDTLTFVKGDTPLCLLHFYVYASTEEILRKVLTCTWLGGIFHRTGQGIHLPGSCLQSIVASF